MPAHCGCVSPLQSIGHGAVATGIWAWVVPPDPGKTAQDFAASLDPPFSEPLVTIQLGRLMTSVARTFTPSLCPEHHYSLKHMHSI